MTIYTMFKDLLNKLFHKRIYLDYASLTPIDPRVLGEMRKYSSSKYANPSSLYKEGVLAKKSIKEVRNRIASSIHAEESEIFFTSGGTESNNLAILGVVESLHEKGLEYGKMHILLSVIEHSSIRECANYLEGKGVLVELIPVNDSGLVSVEDLKKRIRANTVIVSVMTVNNEIGSIQPIREIAKVIRHFRSNKNNDSIFNFQDFSYPIFHTDASQAVLSEEIDVKKTGVDLMTLDGSKIYGPRGSGLLFIKKDLPIVPIIHGGGQESGLRSGTENLPAIMGFGKAIEIADKQRVLEKQRITEIRDYFISGLRKIRPNIKLNAIESFFHTNKGMDIQEKYSPYIVNITIPGIDNEFFVLQLDAKGISCSTKSSCLGDEEESYVLHAINANSKESIRFSFGRWTTKRDVKMVLGIIDKILANN